MKKTLAWLLTLCMILSMIPMYVFAADGDTGSLTQTIGEDTSTGTEVTVTTADELVTNLENGKNVKLGADISQPIYINDLTTDVTLDLNGHTISSSYSAAYTLEIAGGNGSLTIKDSADNGSIKAPDRGAAAVGVSGSDQDVKITGGTFQGGTYGLLIESSAINAKVTIEGGKFSSSASGGSAVDVSGSNAVVGITGGTFQGGSNTLAIVGSGAKVTIEGGEFSSSASGGSAVDVSGSDQVVKITDGTFHNGIYGLRIESSATNAEVIIEGGEFSGNGPGFCVENGTTPDVTLKGGNFGNNSSYKAEWLPDGYEKFDKSTQGAYEVVANTYTVTVADGIANGTVTADKPTAKAGDTVTLTVAPATGYVQDTLTVTAANGATVTVTNNAFEMPAGNVTVTATFKVEITYDLYVAGVGMADGDYLSNDGEISKEKTADGYAYYKDGTLILNNFTSTDKGYEWTSSDNNRTAAIYYGGSTLKLTLEGTSSVTAPDNTGYFYGIYSAGGLSVSGTGSLTATGKIGVNTNGKIEVSSGSLTALGSKGSFSYGVYANGDIKVSGGSLIATGGEATIDNSFGVCAIYGNIEVSGGSLEATGGAATSQSYGVYTWAGDIKVSDGSLTATGGDATNKSHGVDVSNIEVSGGSLEATGGAATNSYGAYGSIKVSGGVTVAQGGTAAFTKMPVTTDFTNAMVWYGATEADAEGKTPDEAAADYYKSQYVRIAEASAYTVTVDATIENGNVEADKTEVSAGERVTLTVTPNAGYELDTLTYNNGTDDVSITANADGAYTFTMPAGNVTVTATFKQPAVYVAGVALKPGQYLAMDAEEGTDQQPDVGYAYLYTDPENGLTLKLHDFNNNGKCIVINGYSGGIWSDYPLTILLDGENTITNEDTVIGDGIVVKQSLVIDGSGTLNVTAKNGNGIFCYADDYHEKSTITINGGEINAKGNQYGILCGYGSMSGDTVTVNGGIVNSIGSKMGIKPTVSGQNKYFEENPGNDNSVTVIGGDAHIITIADVENGKVKANVPAAVEGATVTLTVTPEKGYKLGSLTVTYGEEQTVEVSDANTFVMPDADVTVTATFTRMDLTVTTNNDDGWTYADGVLTINESGSYTVAMSDGVTSTHDRIKVTAENVNLTINGLNITAPEDNSAISTTSPLNLILVGENTLTGGNGSFDLMVGTNGLSAVSGNVKISDGSVDGSGKLTARGGNGSDGFFSEGNGAHAFDGAVTISGGTVIAIGGDSVKAFAKDPTASDDTIALFIKAGSNADEAAAAAPVVRSACVTTWR